ncbi:MAG: transcriptional regulator [Shinella sp.]|nr:transcriptional regulator [Shinella sp.]
MRHSPANRIMILLKTEGPQLASSIGERLGISGEAARQQLTKLAEGGLAEAAAEGSGGRGRPKQLWRLTSAGHRQFPDGHADLAVDLIAKLRSELGAGAVDTLIAAREKASLAAYAAEMQGKEMLGERVATLAELRTREGYMAAWAPEPDGSFLLVENHCPICAAASACQQFCRSELDVFRRVLSASVEREEHVLHGARRCAYRITPL